MLPIHIEGVLEVWNGLRFLSESYVFTTSPNHHVRMFVLIDIEILAEYKN